MDARALRAGFALAAAALFAFSDGATAQDADYGAVHGIVLDYDDTPLGGGEVQLTSREEQFSAPISPDGRFSLHARPGLYSIVVMRPGIVPFQRAQIAVRAGSIMNLNVRPVFDHPDPGVHYFSFVVPGKPEMGAVLRRVDLLRPGARDSFGPDYMMLTYDTLSVYARSIACDRRFLRCTAEGNALIEIGGEDGVSAEHAERAEIALVGRRVALTRGENSAELPF
jgi:hypothetical protein